jgi:6-phosphogluconolactonase
MATPDIAVHSQPNILAAAAAARLLTRLVDLQASGSVPKVVLTGGGVGIALLEQVRATVARDAVDWTQVEFYWGDERFLPPGDPERNETQAREALLDHIRVDPAKVFPMGADMGSGPAGAEDAAAAYAEVLRRAARPEDHGPVPSFDIMMLGMGAEGHTASIFPHSPAVYETERSVVAVHGCPKPPPTRVSLTLPAIRRSAEVWIVATGEAKAAAVAMALSGAGEVAIPVAGAQGRRRTRWLLDRAAATKLPRDLVPPIA